MTRFMISADTEMTMKHIPREVEDKIYNTVDALQQECSRVQDFA